MEDKLISIIVPVYNVEPFLRDCIKSIRNQTYKKIEIILVDDGSTDGSGELCDELKTVDERILVIHKENGGLASARNAGMEVAKGDYIGFIDSDDWIEPDMYECLVNACINNNARMSCCGRIEVLGDKYKREKYVFECEQFWNTKEMIGRLLVYDGCDASACDKLFERSLILKYRFPYGRLHEDIFIMYKIIQDAGSIVHIGKVGYNYRQRVGGITHSEFSVKKMDLVDAVEQVWNDLKNNYPDQKDQQQFFCVTNLMIVILLMRTVRGYKQKYSTENKRIMSLFYQYGNHFLNNKYANLREKIKYILIRLHMSNLYLICKSWFYQLVK